MRTRNLILCLIGGLWLASAGGCPFTDQPSQDLGADFSEFVKNALVQAAESDPLEIDAAAFNLDDQADNYDDVLAGDVAPAPIAGAEVD